MFLLLTWLLYQDQPGRCLLLAWLSFLYEDLPGRCLLLIWLSFLYQDLAGRCFFCSPASWLSNQGLPCRCLWCFPDSPLYQVYCLPVCHASQLCRKCVILGQCRMQGCLDLWYFGSAKLLGSKTTRLMNLHWLGLIYIPKNGEWESSLKYKKTIQSTCGWIFAVLTKMTKTSGGVYVPCICMHARWELQ